MKCSFGFCCTLFVVLGLALLINCESPLICSYTNVEGNFISLHWFPAINRGQSYVDYGKNKDDACVLRASCANNVTWDTKIERCTDFKINCDNKHTFEDEFPACCVKC